MRLTTAFLASCLALSGSAFALDAGQRPSTAKDPSANFNQVITKKIELPDGPEAIVLRGKPLSETLDGKAPLASPIFTGTASFNQITTGRVDMPGGPVGLVLGGKPLSETLDSKAPSASPTFTGLSSFSQINAVRVEMPGGAAGLVLGGKPLSETLDGKAPIASPTFTGTASFSQISAGSPAGVLLGDRTLSVLLGEKAPLASPEFTGLLTAKNFELPGVSTLNLKYALQKNPNTILAGPGNSISFCPALSCVFGPPDGSINAAFGDHQRTSFLISSETQDDSHSEEQTLAITTTVNTGKIRPYAGSTAYAVGDNVAVGNALYRATQAGTTGGNTPPPGSRPTSVPFTVADGSVRWLWINDAAIPAKLGAYIETQVLANGGSAWGFVNNFQMQAGSVSPGMVRFGAEFDFTNNSGTDCALGVTCDAMRIGIGGPNKSTTALDISSGNASAPATIWGMRFGGAFLASDALIALDANSKYGIAANQLGLGGDKFSQALIFDNSASPKSLEIAGPKAVAAIEDRSASPVGLSQGGTKTIAGIREASTSPTGLLFAGTYSQSTVAGPGWRVDPAGNATFASVTGATSYTPPSADSSCGVGSQAWDTNYEYRCVAPNTWRRAALTSW